MARYLNPYTAFGFRKLFGEEASKDLLVDFLNQLLPPRHQIAELQFTIPGQLPGMELEQRQRLKLTCHTTTGERLDVEMQRAKMGYFFRQKTLFYIPRTLPETTYFVAILDFEYDEAEERRKFRRDAALRDQDGEMFFDKLHFKFLQMPLFNKEPHELESHFDKWLYFLKHLDSFDHIPAILNEPIFQKAFQIAELANLSREQYDAYERNLLDYWGVKAAVDTAREEGARAHALDIARRMLADGLDVATVAKYTGLSAAVVTALQRDRD